MENLVMGTHYLSVVRFAMDDIVIGLHTNPASARAAIDNLTVDALHKACDTINSDASLLCCGAVITLVDGRPCSMYTFDLPDLSDGWFKEI